MVVQSHRRTPGRLAVLSTAPPDCGDSSQLPGLLCVSGENHEGQCPRRKRESGANDSPGILFTHTSPPLLQGLVLSKTYAASQLSTELSPPGLSLTSLSSRRTDAGGWGLHLVGMGKLLSPGQFLPKGRQKRGHPRSSAPLATAGRS